MTMQTGHVVHWELADMKSPHLAQHIPVVVARGIPYFANSNRLQTLNLYLPHKVSTRASARSNKAVGLSVPVQLRA